MQTYLDRFILSRPNIRRDIRVYLCFHADGLCVGDGVETISLTKGDFCRVDADV